MIRAHSQPGYIIDTTDGKGISGIVVVGPKAGDGKLLFIWNQLPGDSASVGEAVKIAHLKAPMPMDWFQ